MEDLRDRSKRKRVLISFSRASWPSLRSHFPWMSHGNKRRRAARKEKVSMKTRPNEMMDYQRVAPWKEREAHKQTRSCQSIQRQTRSCQSIQRQTRSCQSIQRQTRSCKQTRWIRSKNDPIIDRSSTKYTERHRIQCRTRSQPTQQMSRRKSAPEIWFAITTSQFVCPSELMNSSERQAIRRRLSRRMCSLCTRSMGSPNCDLKMVMLCSVIHKSNG